MGYVSTALDSQSLLIATTDLESKEYTIKVALVRVLNRRVTDLLSAPTQGLQSFFLYSHEGRGYLAFVERHEGLSQIKEQAIPVYGEKACDPVIIRECVGIVAGLVVHVDSLGNTYYAWSSNEHGPRNIHLHVRDEKGAVLWDSYLNSPSTVDVSPVIAATPDRRVHFMHRETKGPVTEMVYTVLDLNLGEVVSTMRLGRVSEEPDHMPSLLTNDDGSVSVLWVRESLLRGQVRGSAISHGRISSSGDWIIPQTALHNQPGVNSDLSAARSESTLAVWLNNETGSFQVSYLELDRQGGLLSHGPVTVGRRHAFSPQVHYVGGYRTVLYQALERDLTHVFLVDDVNPARPPLSFMLGLDLEQPLLDGVYKYFSLGVAALVLACLAGLGIGLALVVVVLCRRARIFGSSVDSVTPLLIAVTMLSVLKRVSTFLYYGAVLVPGVTGILIAVGSAVFAVMGLRLADMEPGETLGIAAGSFLFVACDTFCSLYLRGLGAW
jgi:hypothetical protein